MLMIPERFSMYAAFIFASFIFGALPIRAESSAKRPKQNNAVPLKRYSLEECYTKAVEVSETLGIQEADLKKAQAQYDEAFSAVFPKVHALATERLQNSSTGSQNSSSTFDSSGSSTLGPPRRDKLQTYINVKQPIFTGLKDIYLVKAAKAELRAQGKDVARTKQLLYLDVAEAFYQILLYEGDLAILDKTQIAIVKRIADLSERIKLGKSRESEVLAAEADKADVLAVKEQTQGLLNATRDLLSFFTKIPSSELTLTDSSKFLVTEPLDIHLEAVKSRPDVTSSFEREFSAGEQVKAARGGRWPTISAEGNVYTFTNPELAQDWDVLLKFDLPIFEGGAIDAKIAEQNAAYEAQRLQASQVARTAEKEVRVAYDNFVSSAARAGALKILETKSLKNYESQIKDYELGVVTNLDVLNALRQAYDAERSLLSAEMDKKINFVKLNVASGRVQ